MEAIIEKLDRLRNTGKRLRATKRPAPRRTELGLSQSQIARMKRSLLGSVCSEPWIDAQFYDIKDKAPDGTVISVNIHDPSVYPPLADTTPMRLCRICEIPYPAYYVSTEYVIDGHTYRSWPATVDARHDIMAEAVAQLQGFGQIVRVRGVLVYFSDAFMARKAVEANVVWMSRYAIDHRAVYVHRGHIRTTGVCHDCYVCHRVDKHNAGYAASIEKRERPTDPEAVR